MARFERLLILALPFASVAACNAIVGLDGFHDVACDESCGDGAPSEDTGAAEDSPGAIFGDDTGVDAVTPLDAGVDSPTSAPDTGPPVDAGPPPDATSSVDLRWPLWLMPNGAEAGLPNPASYVAVGDGGARDLVTGLLWSPPVAASTLSAAAASCSYPSRVPTRIELVSILDTSQSSPPLVNPVFAGFPGAAFWTSSVTPGGNSWTVDFGGGAVGPSNQASWVTCVALADGGAP